MALSKAGTLRKMKIDGASFCYQLIFRFFHKASKMLILFTNCGLCLYKYLTLQWLGCILAAEWGRRTWGKLFNNSSPPH